jgi:hypothetical protein
MRFSATAAAVAVAAGCLAAAGCTARNPDYTGGGGGAGGSGGVGGGDLAGVRVDLAGAVFDLSGPMGACTGDQRQCSGPVASDRCQGGMFVVDRTCPKGSSCTADYCAPPPRVFGAPQVGARCDANGGAQQIQCMAVPMLSCQPFVDGPSHTLRWFCDSSVGAGTAATPCTSGSECRSGVCAIIAGVCFDACQSDADCRAVAANLTCKSLAITVEGVAVTADGCD